MTARRFSLRKPTENLRGIFRAREKYRRRGAGYALFSALIAEVKARGVKSVFLLVRSDNAAAIALYGKCGFIKVGERPRYYKGKDALIMRLNL